MFLVKIFERKWVIRSFGIALILAPFFNVANSVMELPGIEKKYLIFYCWQFYKSAPWPQQLIQLGSVLIGFTMLKGAVSAWKYTLGLLGCYIVIQFTQLNANIHDNWNWIYLGVNILTFFFIADQIVLKPRVPSTVKPVAAAPVVPPVEAPVFAQETPKLVEVVTENGSFTTFASASASESQSVMPEIAMPLESMPSVAPMVEVVAPTVEAVAPSVKEEDSFQSFEEHTALEIEQPPVSSSSNVTPIRSSKPQYRSNKKIYVNFDGFGKWGQISDISEEGVRVRAIAPSPPDITSRTIELLLGSVYLRLKFYQQDGAEYTFHFQSLSSVEKRSLNEWLVSIAV